MSKLLTIKNFILKTSNYLFKIIMKILFFPFKLIIQFIDVILTELFSITFRNIVKFVLVSFIVSFLHTFVWKIFKIIFLFSIPVIETYIKHGRL